MTRLLFALALALACAPLNTATMSDSCRYAYNACLSRCPTATPNPSGDSVPKAAPEQDQFAVAHCTQACNEQAQKCK